MSKTTEAVRMFRVGEPELPELEDIQPLFSDIWEAQDFTNLSTYFRLFERALSEYLEVDNIIVFANGTSALEALISVIRCKKPKVLTSPFTFNATSTAIIRNFLTPLFTDITETDGNIDPKKVLEALDKQVGMILGVHCYGFPCDIESLNDISNKESIPVIYDAAHCMGAKYRNKHLASFGLASVLSFHATKVFSSIEGGAVVTADKSLAIELRKFRNFGFDEKKNAHSLLGTNSKLSELHAAVGLTQLKCLDNVLERRREVYEIYSEGLSPIEGLKMLQPRHSTLVNASYIPISLNGDKDLREKLIVNLKNKQVHTKAYFNVNLAELIGENNSGLQVTDYLKDRVLCLPVHSKMKRADVEYIIKNIEDLLD